MMDREEISVEEFELLCDEDKAKYYRSVSINIVTKLQTHSYELWSVRNARSIRAKIERTEKNIK